MPSPTDGVTALRGTLVTCRDDPFLTDPAQALRGRNRRHRDLPQWLIEAVGPRRAASRFAAGRHRVADLSGLPDRARLHRHACALRADRHRRLLRRAIARLARPLRLPGRDGVRRSGACGRDGEGVLRRACCATAPPRALVFCAVYPQSVDALFEEAETPRHAHRRRQGADGPQRAGRAARHRAAAATTNPRR